MAIRDFDAEVGHVSVAYSTQLAAALSGASIRQLGHWRRTGVIGAEHRTDTRVYYSYRDIVALRTCVYLRQDASLQRIRIAIGTLRSLGELEHLSAYKLVAIGKTIALVRDDRTATDLVVHRGQELLAHMADVLGPFRTESGREVLNFTRPFPNVSIDPGMRGGHPVVSRTRIAFEAVAGLLADGVPPEEIADFYPSVTPEAARDALRFSQYVSEFAERPAS